MGLSGARRTLYISLHIHLCVHDAHPLIQASLVLRGLELLHSKLGSFVSTSASLFQSAGHLMLPCSVACSPHRNPHHYDTILLQLDYPCVCPTFLSPPLSAEPPTVK